MNKKIFFIFIVLVAAAALGGIIYLNRGYEPAGTNVPYGTGGAFPASKESGTSGVKTAPPSVIKTPKTFTVNLGDTGPSPKILDISSGDTVKFVNIGTRPYWVASDPHPTHDLCPGFDAVHGLVHNESWSYTFKYPAPKTCFYHNHLDVTTGWYKGTINIK